MRGGVENTSSNFKLKRESLPQWAVDWAKNRFNMDTKNVKFYVMDEQEAYDSVALASGNSIFVNSDHKNDEEVIKHELTHIYQQAIGTATEGNVGDSSLEKEAVQVSEEGDTSIAKTQVQGNGYILPREKTNVVQYKMSAGTITGLVIGGILTLGIFPLSMWLAKQIKYKKVARKSGLRLETVKKVCGIFKWAYEDVYEVIDLCTMVNEKKIQEDQLIYDSVVLKKLKEYGIAYTSEELIHHYSTMLKNGFKGFETEREGLSEYFDIGIKVFTFNQNGTTKSNTKAGALSLNSRVSDSTNGEAGLREESEKYYIHENYVKLYNLTDGFKDRTVEQVSKDIKLGFDCDLLTISEDQMLTYYKLYNISNGFKERKIERIQEDVRLYFGCYLANVSSGQLDKYFEIYNKNKKFEKSKSRQFEKYKIYIELYNLTAGFHDRTLDQINKDVKFCFGCDLMHASEDRMDMYAFIYLRSGGFTGRDVKQIQDDIKLFFNCDLKRISSSKLEMYFDLYDNNERFTKKESWEIKEIVEYISGYKFWCAIDAFSWYSLKQDTEWFSKMTPQEVVVVRDKLANFLNIKIDDSETWLYLIDDISAYLIRETGCFKNITINAFIDRLKILISCDDILYNKMRQGQDYCQIQLIEMFRNCIKSFKIFPSLNNKEAVVRFMVYDRISRDYPRCGAMIERAYLLANKLGGFI